MNRLPILLILLSVLTSAQARLGETREQAEARYGLPKRGQASNLQIPLIQGARELTFHYEGYQIRCALLKATDGQEYIVRMEYSRLKRPGGLKDYEFAAILEAQRNGQEWKRRFGRNMLNGKVQELHNNFAKDVLSSQVYVRTDGAVATHRLGFAILELPQAAKYEAELAAIKERKARAAVPKF